jgi:hypothetical protein
MGKQPNKIAWQKTAIEISGIGNTSERVVEVIIKDTGKPASIRRDLAEFYPGRVFVPLWLARRINPKGVFS